MPAFHRKSAFLMTGYSSSCVTIGTAFLFGTSSFLLSLELNVWLLLEPNA